MVVTAHPARVNRNPEPMPTIATAMESLALKQNLNHLLFQMFDLGHMQQGHDILDRVAMRHRKTKQAFVVLLELYILTVLIVLVAGARFEEEHRQTSSQVSGQFIIGGFFAAIFHLPHPGKQLRKVKANSTVHLIHKFLFLLLLAGDCLFPGCCLALFGFFCSALGVRSRFVFGVFSLGVGFLSVELMENRSLFTETTGKIKF